MNKSKTTLLLMELVIMVMFFSIAAAICMNVFASAQVTADDSANRSMAGIHAQSAVDCYKAVKGDLAECVEILGGVTDGSVMYIFFDDKWNLCDSENSSAEGFTVSLLKFAGGNISVTVSVNGTEGLLFDIGAYIY